jgi:hypothetical protein
MDVTSLGPSGPDCEHRPNHGSTALKLVEGRSPIHLQLARALTGCT